jgi:hypothetical protein
MVGVGRTEEISPHAEMQGLEHAIGGADADGVARSSGQRPRARSRAGMPRLLGMLVTLGCISVMWGAGRPAEVERFVAGRHGPTPAATAGGGPTYSGACLEATAADYDCGGGNGPRYTGSVQVIGDERYELDRDGDGVACDAS